MKQWLSLTQKDSRPACAAGLYDMKLVQIYGFLFELPIFIPIN